MMTLYFLKLSSGHVIIIVVFSITKQSCSSKETYIYEMIIMKECRLQEGGGGGACNEGMVGREGVTSVRQQGVTDA